MQSDVDYYEVSVVFTGEPEKLLEKGTELKGTSHDTCK